MPTRVTLDARTASTRRPRAARKTTTATTPA
jgi:hypothetical protein